MPRHAEIVTVLSMGWDVGRAPRVRGEETRYIVEERDGARTQSHTRDQRVAPRTPPGGGQGFAKAQCDGEGGSRVEETERGPI